MAKEIVYYEVTKSYGGRYERIVLSGCKGQFKAH